jgi:hypothetical protein
VPGCVYPPNAHFRERSGKAHSGRTFAYVTKKRLKVVYPPRPYGHAPTAIVVIADRVFIKTSRFHVAPSEVCSGIAAPRSMRVLGYDFPIQAPARLRESISKRLVEDRHLVSTVALTHNHPSASAIWVAPERCIAENEKSSKPFANEGYFGGHSIGYLNVLSRGRCSSAVRTSYPTPTSSALNN